MNKTQKYIFDLIKDELYSLNPDIKDLPINKILKFMFRNHRNNTSSKCLRLTNLAFGLVETKIKFWSFDFSGNPLTTQDFLILDRTQKYPYYYNGQSFTLHTACPTLSMHLKISDNNLRLFSEK